MSKAAETLFVSQPNLSTSISRLEEEVGVPLFERRRGRIALNQNGALLLKSVEQALSILDSGVQAVRDLHSGKAAPLSLACMVDDTDLLSAFVLANPDVNLVQQRADLPAITQMLDNCEVLSGSDPMCDAVKDGTYPIGFVNEDLGLKWLEAGLPIELIYPEDGVINTVDCLSIIKGAKNMDNAKLFIDFFGSPENHAVLVDPILRRSTRVDAPLAEGLTPTTEYNLVDADKISRDDITDQYNAAYEQSRAN